MNEYETLREKFFTFLMRRPCTYKQAREYLSRQKIPVNYIDAMMNEAQDTGLIDDFAFSRLFVDGHLSWGNLKISHELGIRGVSRGDIEAALEEAEDESLRAQEISEGLRSSGVEERKIAARLLSRGFSKRSVKEAVKGKEF